MKKILFALALLLSIPFFAVASTCPNLTRTLSYGSRGPDVLQLQDFLIAQGDLGAGNNTGYFGRLTKTAVIRFQSRQNLPATGLVGPLTRAAIAKSCSNRGAVSGTIGNLTASPSSGFVPQMVAFSAPIPTNNPNDYRIDFGDGHMTHNDGNPSSETTGTTCEGPVHGPLSCNVVARHVYRETGTFVATLSGPNGLSEHTTVSIAGSSPDYQKCVVRCGWVCTENLNDPPDSRWNCPFMPVGSGNGIGCYSTKYSSCAEQSDGSCGWTQTAALAQCLADNKVQ